MTTIYVQFTSSAETAIQSVFSCPQDATAFPNQGQIDSTDARYTAFKALFPANTPWPA